MNFAVPPLQTLSADVAAKLSPDAIERHTRLACIVHLMHDMADCLGKDLADPANQTEEALSFREYAALSTAVITGLKTLCKLPYSGNLTKLVAGCNSPSGSPPTDIIPPEAC